MLGFGLSRQGSDEVFMGFPTVMCLSEGGSHRVSWTFLGFHRLVAMGPVFLLRGASGNKH